MSRPNLLKLQPCNLQDTLHHRLPGHILVAAS